MSKLFRSSRPDGCTSPRPYSDATMRTMNRGKILPMEEPSWLDRLLGRH